MTPDQIRRSWDDDDTPRSVFPEPLAERLTRENKALRAEVERLRESERTAWAVHREHVDGMGPIIARHAGDATFERVRADSAEADLRALREGLEGILDFLDGPHPDAKYEDGKRAGAQMIRALLAPSPAEGTGEAVVMACPCGCSLSRPVPVAVTPSAEETR